MKNNYLKRLDTEYPHLKTLLENKLANLLKYSKIYDGNVIEAEVKIDNESMTSAVSFRSFGSEKTRTVYSDYKIDDFVIDSSDENLTYAYNSFMAELFKIEYINDSKKYFSHNLPAKLNLTYKHIENSINYSLNDFEEENYPSRKKLDIPDEIIPKSKEIANYTKTNRHEKIAKIIAKHNKKEEKPYSLNDFEEENQKIRDYDTPDEIYTEEDGLSK